MLALRDVCATKFSEWLREIRVVSVKFYFHTDITEFTEAHRLRVLALRDVCATKFSGWLCEIRVVCVIFYFHTDFTKRTETHGLRVLAMQDVCAKKCAERLRAFRVVCVTYKIVRVKWKAACVNCKFVCMKSSSVLAMWDAFFLIYVIFA